MSEIYIYDPKCEDFTNYGLVGALVPTSCIFEEEANGMSEITLEHPLDNFGRYRALTINNILKVEVPVRTTPEIQESPDGITPGTTMLVTNVWICKVRSAGAAYRTLYTTRTGSRRIRTLAAGQQVTVVQKYDEGRWKVKSQYGAGWIHQEGLTEEKAVEIADKSQGIESVEPAWTVKPQFFRIYEVRKNISSVTVAARHITYDLLYNTTTYESNLSVNCSTALAGIFDNLSAKQEEFTAYTNLNNEYTGIEWARINAINALLDPDTGLTALFKANLVRDNWEMYFLDDPGMDRGVTIEYARNMTGIEYIENTDDIVTRIIPIGETKDGKPLPYREIDENGWEVMPRRNYIDSMRQVTVDGEEMAIVYAYPIIYTMVLECENCKIGSGGVQNALQAYARMREQAQALFDEDIDLPKIEMSVDFINLGDTEDYKQFRNLERLFLYDYVRVRHAKQGIDVMAKIVSIKWDCLLERMERMEIGSSIKTLANTQTFSPAGQYVSKGLPSTGGTVSGALYLDADPVDPMEAATKQYVDKAVSNSTGNTGGKNGTTFIPSVSDDGIISWTNDGGLSNPSPVNIKGTPGDPGYTPQKGIDYFDGLPGTPGVGIIDITIEEVV